MANCKICGLGAFRPARTVIGGRCVFGNLDLHRWEQLLPNTFVLVE